MQQYKIIGITGKARHGKDTLYRRVLAPLGYDRVANADPVKGVYFSRLAAIAVVQATQAMETLLVRPTMAEQAQFVAEQYYTAFGSRKSPFSRNQLQQIGTEEVRHKVDPGFWVWLTLKEIKNIVEDGGMAAVTDVRFPNEARAIQGDAEWMTRFYADLEATGGAFLDNIRHDLTHTWDEGGVLPPKGLGGVVKVVRTSGAEIEGGAEAAKHSSETEVEAIQADVTLEAGSVEELVRAGSAQFAPLEVVRFFTRSRGAVEITEELYRAMLESFAQNLIGKFEFPPLGTMHYILPKIASVVDIEDIRAHWEALLEGTIDAGVASPRLVGVKGE